MKFKQEDIFLLVPVDVFLLDLGISLTSFVKIVFTYQLRPTCIGQKYAMSAQSSPNLSMRARSLVPMLLKLNMDDNQYFGWAERLNPSAASQQCFMSLREEGGHRD